jgi:hypothetical protein
MDHVHPHSRHEGRICGSVRVKPRDAEADKLSSYPAKCACDVDEPRWHFG